MARPLKIDGDPLVAMAIRIPMSLSNQIRQDAQASGATLSDHVRAHLSHTADTDPLKNKRPRARVRPLKAPSSIDPELMRKIAGIGTNINQIAKACNSDLLTGMSIDAVKLLVVLRSMEREIMVIAEQNGA